MTSDSSADREEDLTGLLNRGLAGESSANDRAFGLVYAELRRSAQRQMRRSGSGAATLSPTGLVNEVFLKLNSGAARTVNDRVHFYSMAAKAMRQVLLDHRRGKDAIKRGSDVVRVELTVEAFATERNAIDYFALEQAMESLAQIDPRGAKVVDWHFFAGLNFLEIADLLEISDKTVRRDWESARSYLLLQLSTR